MAEKTPHQKGAEGLSALHAAHRKRERDATPQEVEDNFQYFMATRHERVAALWAWLDKHFPDKTQKDPFDRLLDFIAAYQGVLTPSSRDETLYTYYTYELPWEGEQAWASLVFDLGTAVGEMILERRPGGHWAKEWDLTLIPNYKTRFDPATVNLLECRAKELCGRDERPLIVWPDDPECPLEEVHEFLFSNLVLWAGNALLDQNWHIRTHYPPGLRTDPDYIKIGFKGVVSTPRKLKG